jgi:hypothetical protein
MLIAIVSIVGALLTWWAVLLEGRASDEDRRAIFETILFEQNANSAEVGARSEATSVARYQTILAEADVLERLAAKTAERGEGRRAKELIDQAQMLRSVASTFSQATFPLEALKGHKVDNESDVAPEVSELTFDVAERRDALKRQWVAPEGEVWRLNPERTAALANTLYRRSVRLVGWVVVLVSTIVLLTVARLSPEPLRPWLAGAGMAIFIIATTVAVIGTQT